MELSILFLTVLGLVSGSVAAFPDPLALTGGSFFVHDPSLVQRASDEKYFLFTTHDLGGILTATNLAGYVLRFPRIIFVVLNRFRPWTSVGSILSGESSINLRTSSDHANMLSSRCSRIRGHLQPDVTTSGHRM